MFNLKVFLKIYYLASFMKISPIPASKFSKGVLFLNSQYLPVTWWLFTKSISSFAKFFKYIIDKKITYKDFVEFNKLSCAVSGYLIDPNSDSEFLFIKESETSKKICGNYYRCCVPCSCDLMKYSEAQKMKHKFEDGFKEFYVLTIKNPCSKKDFPNRVN